MKRYEVLIHTTTLMNLKNILLSDRSQTQKTTYCMTPFVGNIQNKQILKRQKANWRFPEARYWGVHAELLLNRQLSFGLIKRLWN